MVKIQFEQIAKRYVHEGREIVAVHDFTVSVEEGEFLCLLGPSGCGKSTVLGLLLGVVSPSAGRLLVDGAPVQGPGPNRACVFQDYALFPWLTVVDNVAFGLEAQGVAREERRSRATALLAALGLESYCNAYPHVLSGGMKQRASIARALAVNPDILLMDEPFAALDALTRTRLQQELLGIWLVARKTVVFVTHSIEEACLLSDRIVVMSASPGEIRDVIPCDAPRPRDLSDDRMVPVIRRVRSALGEEFSAVRPSRFDRIADVLRGASAAPRAIES